MMTKPANLIPKQQVDPTLPVHTIRSRAGSILKPKKTHINTPRSFINTIKPITAALSSGRSRRTPNSKTMHQVHHLQPSMTFLMLQVPNVFSDFWISGFLDFWISGFLDFCCPVLSCPVLSCPVLSVPAWFRLVPSCVVPSGPVLS